MSTAVPGLDAIRATAVAAARAAGGIQRAARGAPLRIERKGAADIATDVDLACEQRIVAMVLAGHPGHGIEGEEGAAVTSTGAWTWIIDPLDGTKNYAHGSLRCAVSIAVALDGVVLVGVVYAPFVDELYVATRGAGATCNGEGIRVASTVDLSEAMVTTALTYAGRAAEPVQTARVVRVFGAVRAVRSMGCAALDLCDVARGRFDGYFEPGLARWDTAAGTLMVTEAGGRVTTFAGDDHAPGAPSVLATNGRIHAPLRALMDGAP